MTDKQKLDLIKMAVKYQADDETLWIRNPPDWQSNQPKHIVTIGEAYVQQSLGWLHRVIEEQDMQAYQCIENQNLGEI